MPAPDAGGMSTAGIWQILSAGQAIKQGKSLESEQEQETVPCFGRDWGDVRMWAQNRSMELNKHGFLPQLCRQLSNIG